MASGGKIRIPGRQSPDAMQVIGQNNDGLDRKWSASAGRLEHPPKVINVFGQEFPAAFQQRDREEERAAGNKGADILGHKSGLTQLPISEGGMRFAFPPYGKKYGPVSLHNISITKIAHGKLTVISAQLQPK